MWVSWFTGFLAGFLCLALIEVCAISFLLKRLLGRHHRPSSSPSSSASVTYQPPHIFLQGDMWVAALPASAIKKDTIKILAQRERAPKDQRRKKELSDDCVEIYPSRRHARLENNILTLESEDGCEERIEMRGCNVLSVSGGKEMSRKWAKKYPIQLESFNQQLLVKSSVCLLYLETSWEKETWCQVLRAAARWTTEKENWYIARKREFHDYCERLDEAYPAFAKAIGSKSKRLFEDEKGGKLDKDLVSGLSRRQRFWKKVTKKGSSKVNATVYTGTGDLSSRLLASKSAPIRNDDLLESHLLMEGSFGNESTGSSSFQSNPEKVYVDDTNCLSDSAKSIENAVLQQDVPTTVLDQGAMCWNIICSRLFFDGYHSSRFQEACHKLIQKQFLKIVTPGYMGKIGCSKFELGSRPPIFHSMHVLPKDSDFIWSFDAVVEYSGGAQIKIDTRLDVRDSTSQENVLNQSLEPTLAGAAAADILRKGLETVEESADANMVRATDTEAGVSGGEKAQSSKGRWKTMLARVADQVSMVPITMSMKLVSLKGTIRVRIKPPPTDRIWFGFTSMPTIELQPEPSIGDHKITTGPVITFITNRIKMLIQETLVLPNCEGVWVPWMIAETEDWIPQSARPVPWSPLETRDSMSREESQAMKDATLSAVTQTLPAGKVGSVTSLSEESNQLYELEKPLLCNDNLVSESEPGDPSATIESTSTPSSVRLRSVSSTDRLDANNRSSRRAKMLNLGKKVTEKLVEKVREGMEKYEQGAR